MATLMEKDILLEFSTKEDNIAEILNTQKLNTTTKQDKKRSN